MDYDVHIALEVDGASIIATLPGTSYHVIFSKTDKRTGLFQGAAVVCDHSAPIPQEAFERLAWMAAIEKARGLGWVE